MRSDTAYTSRQMRLLTAIYDKIHEIDDPDPDVITRDTYDWSIDQTAQFGSIPKIRFSPNACRLKADIVSVASLSDPLRAAQIQKIRESYGFKAARNQEARLFDAEWNNIMFKAKKALLIIGILNNLFSREEEVMAKPVDLLQQIILKEKEQVFRTDKPLADPSVYPKPSKTQEFLNIRGYNEELEELE